MISGFIALLISHQNTSGPGGFRRRLLPGSVTVTAVLPNSYRMLAIAGETAGRLYFSASTPDRLLTTDEKLRYPLLVQPPLPPAKKLTGNFSYKVTEGRLWLFAGNVPAVYRYRLHPLALERKILLPAIFTGAVMTGQGGILFRILETNHRGADAVFAVYHPSTKNLGYEQAISERRGDLGFSSDGMLRYDALTGRSVYIEFYRNRLLCLDTGLRLRYRGHTIDTVRTNRATYSRFRTVFGNSSPKLLVNADAAANGGRLFVRSAIAADHDPVSGCPIDIYTINNGKYLGSLSLPLDNGSAPLHFSVSRDQLMAVYPARIILYRLPELTGPGTAH